MTSGSAYGSTPQYGSNGNQQNGSTNGNSEDVTLDALHTGKVRASFQQHSDKNGGIWTLEDGRKFNEKSGQLRPH